MNVRTPEIRWHFGPTGMNEAIMSVDTAPARDKDVTVIATGGADKDVKLWTCSTATPADDEQNLAIEFVHNFSAHDRSVNTIRFSPDKHHLASASDDATIIVWSRVKTPMVEWEDVKADSDVLRKYLSCGHKGDIIDISWSPDSLYLCSTSVDNRVVIWHVSSGQIIQALEDHGQFVQVCTTPYQR